VLLAAPPRHYTSSTVKNGAGSLTPSPLLGGHIMLGLVGAALATGCLAAPTSVQPVVRFFKCEGGGYGVAPVGIDMGWRQPNPLQLEIAGAAGDSVWLRVGYSTVDAVGGASATGTVVSARGSRFHIADNFSVTAGIGFVVRRRVTVTAAGEGDIGFASRFSLVSDAAVSLRQREFFMPGVWYLHSQALAPAGALAGDLDAPAVLVREDRLPLPMVMVREPGSGATLSLVHRQPNGASFTGENFAKRIVDSRMQFGSVGVLSGAGSSPAGRLEVALQFPGSEGSRTYICCHADWANRSHPVQPDFEHSYQVRLTLDPGGPSHSYGGAVRAAWREAFAEAAPQLPVHADMAKVYRSGIDLLSTVSLDYHGTRVVPFAVMIPNGTVTDTSSQMGFVGKALPAAALMVRDALARGDQARLDAAVAVVDVWVKQSMTASGVLKTWFNTCQPSPHANGGRCPPGAPVGGPLRWRADSPYGGHLRIMSDGAIGVLHSWSLMQRQRQKQRHGATASTTQSSPDPKPEWLAFARRHGDFLVRAQQDDGSIAGEWSWDGQVSGNFTNVSDHPIPLLLALHNATGAAEYLNAALAAGRFSAAQMAATFAYIGGACDNPNVLDKEAGALALRAFVALFDATGDRSWLAPAQQAALFTETWTMAWSVPLNRDDPSAIYPASRTTLGASLIATGQSGADNFMAYAVYDFYRLYDATRDKHYLRFAEFLQDATKQVMDWDGSLGYAYPGLMNEAMRLAPPRGHGVYKWLPWLTVVMLEPMVRLQERFGSFDVRQLVPPTSLE
jgi:hypothetical protein